jgi:phosphoribosyl 1,2-cyclic phosphodiesterase
MKVKFWGTRGSIPVPGEETIKYGGNTSCLEIITRSGKSKIIDAGTGIRKLGKEIISKNTQTEFDLLLTHSHWDHIQGLPFFAPLFNSKYKINVYNCLKENIKKDYIFTEQLNPLFFPVDKEVILADLKFDTIESGQNLKLGELDIDIFETHHSKNTLTFKIKEDDKSFVYMTDNEIYYDTKTDLPDMNSVNEQNQDLINFIKGSQFLIHDTMYTIEDYKSKIGWGHSNNYSVALLGILSEVQNLVLFHYDPDYGDDVVDDLIKDTQKILKENNSAINLIAARETTLLNI